MHQFLLDFSKTSSQSDKIKQHGYHRIHPWFIGHLKNVPVTLLEIGLKNNDSIELWKQYFNDVEVYGIDIDPKEYVSDAKLFKLDQSKQNELENFATIVNCKFDIIVDDGSHVPAHQLKTINTLWALLKPGGIYIIEDIETSYWGSAKCYNYRFNANIKKNNLIYQFVSCIKWINKEFAVKIVKSKEVVLSDEVLNETEIISFAYNSIVLIKKDPSFNQYYERPYRYINKINAYSFPNRILKKIIKAIRN